MRLCGNLQKGVAGRGMACAKDLGQRTQLCKGFGRERVLRVGGGTGDWSLTSQGAGAEWVGGGQGSQLMGLEGETETQRWCLVRKASHLRVEAGSRKPLGEHSRPVSHGAFSRSRLAPGGEQGKGAGLGPHCLGGQACDLPPPPLSGRLPGPARPTPSQTL